MFIWKSLQCNSDWFWYNKGFCPFQKPSTSGSWCNPSLSIYIPPTVTSDGNGSWLFIAVLCTQSSSYFITSVCPGHLPWCYSPSLVFCKSLAHFCLPDCLLLSLHTAWLLHSLLPQAHLTHWHLLFGSDSWWILFCLSSPIKTDLQSCLVHRIDT